ncbi:MAG: hypothetical protein IJS86_01660 [Lachnospiraceae bacterium]|nr:hypothetical protein [Lachnospiraceae bacterium]
MKMEKNMPAVSSITEIPHGMRIRMEGLLNLDITSFAKGDLNFTLSRLLGYESDDRGFELTEAPEETALFAGEGEVTLETGGFTLRAGKERFGITVEREGRILLSMGEDSLSYEKDEKAGEAFGYSGFLTASFCISPLETIWGLGGKNTSFVKNFRTLKDVYPVFFSDRGYALLCDHREGVSFSISDPKPGVIVIKVPGERLSFHLVSGKDIEETISDMKELTGKAPLPDVCSLNPWLFADPMTVCDSDTIDPLHKEGFKLCVNAGPFVRQDDVLFEEGLAGGFFAKRSDGHGIIQEEGLPGAPALIDITDDEAVSWYAGKIKELCDRGVDGLSSYYPEIFNALMPKLSEKADGGLSVSLFSAGPEPDMPSVIYRTVSDGAGFSDMAQSLRSGLSMIFGGVSYFCHEIPFDPQDHDSEAMKRWIQYGCFSTYFGIRVFENMSGGDFFFGDEAEVFKKFSGIRNMLMPYIFEQVRKTHETGMPVVRPMAMAFPEDPACTHLDLQYMLGDSILVAPVFERGGKCRFYLPAGKWKNLLDDEILEGAGFFEREYDDLHMAAFVRENTLLPVGGTADRPDYDYTKGLTLHYFLPVIGKGIVTEIPDGTGNTVMSFKGFFGGERAEVRMLSPTGMGKVPVTVHHLDGTEENGYTL